MKQFWGVFLLVGSLWASLEAKAQSPYPPSGFMRVGSQVRLELRQGWTSTITGKDSEGDWEGDARSNNGTTGKVFAFALSNNGFRFQVAYAGASEFCDLVGANSVVSANSSSVTYNGSRFFKQGTGNIISDNTSCRVVVTNAVVTTPTQPVQPVQPVQPPALPGAQAQLPALTFPPRLEVGQRWEIRLGNRAIVYRGVLSSLDSARNVYIGTLTTNGIGDPVAQRRFEVFLSGDTLAMYATDPQGNTTVCSFTGAGSLQNNILTGIVFFKAATDTQFRTLTAVSDAPCKANLEPVQQAVQPVSPVQPVQPVQPATQNLTPSLPALVNDTWRVVANGNLGLEPWVVTFSRTETDGTLVGIATQGNGRGEVNGFKTQDGGYAFVMEVNNRVIACVTVANTPVVSGGFLGQLVEIVQNQAKSLNTSCTLTLTARGGVAGTVTTPFSPVQPTQPTQPFQQPLVAILPTQVGDSWRITASGYTPWLLSFTSLDQGSTVGTSTQGTVKGEALGLKQSNGGFAFLFEASNRVFACVIPANTQPQGANISGSLFEIVTVNNQSQTKDLNTACVATITARAGVGAGNTVTPAQPFIASFPPKVGQTWTVTIEGLAPWVINFSKLDSDNDPTGLAVQNGVSRDALAFTNQGTRVFLMAGVDGNYYCLLAANIQPTGSSFTGGVAAFIPKGGKDLQALNKSCTATLTSQTLLQTASQAIEARVPNPLKLLPLF